MCEDEQDSTVQTDILFPFKIVDKMSKLAIVVNVNERNGCGGSVFHGADEDEGNH